MKQSGRIIIMGILATVLVAGTAAAGTGPDLGLGTPAPSTDLLNSGILDFSRIKLSHSLSYGFASSSTYGNASGGLWNTRASYRISNPLEISVDVGAMINPGDGGPFLSTENIFLRGVNLDYRPSKNFQLHVAYLNIPAGVSPAFRAYHDRHFGYGSWGSPLSIDR